MVSENRSVRIADRFHKDLQLLLLEEISDPRLDGVNVNAVDLDRELSFADIYVSAVDGGERREDILQALKGAAGFIRSQLAASVSHLRSFPQLRFHWDPVPERVDRIDQIIAELEAEEDQDKD
jgi:ribosome-binding factor A